MLNETYYNYMNVNLEKGWFALVAIDVWIFFGNLFVILLIFAFKKLFDNNTTKIILSLSITDLLLSIFVLPFTIYYQVNGEWSLTKGACIFWLSSDMQLTTASILHLCAISFERYLSIARPIEFRTQIRKRIITLILISWLLSFILCTIPFALIATLVDGFVIQLSHNNKIRCSFFSQYFLAYASMITFWLPLCLMIFFGVKTIWYIKKKAKENFQRRSVFKLQSNALKLLTREPKSVSFNDNFDNSIQKSIEIQKSLKRREIQAQRTLIVVLIVFVLSYFPLFVFFAFSIICNNSCNFLVDFDTNLIYVTTTWLGYLSSGINPCLYAFFNSNFKSALKSIFK
jgi:hypothetical protein